MATYLRKLKDRNGNTIVPATKFAGVFQDGSNQSLSVWTENMSEWVQKLEDRIDTKATKLECYPVGSTYLGANSSSPASLFGGSWTRIKGAYIRAGNDSDSPGWIGGSDTRTLTASNIPSLSMQVGLTSAGYVNSNKVVQSFIMNNKIGPLGNEGMESKGCSGDPSDKQPGAADYGVGYRASSLVRYYNSSVQPISIQPKMCNLYVWYRVS